MKRRSRNLIQLSLGLALIPLMGQVGPCGLEGPTGPRGESGPTGPAGPAGDRIPGDPGANCWDLNGNGRDDPEEDVNGDGVFTTLDCRGSAGAAGTTGLPGAPGTQGQSGQDGSDGAPGVPGTACWDLNGNGNVDLPDEDSNSDGVVDVQDCRGSGLACADCDGRFVNEGQSSSISTTMLQNRAITLGKLNTTGASTGDVIKYDGANFQFGEDETAAGGVTDHGELSGLSDDDHKQYLLLESPRDVGASEYNIGQKSLVLRNPSGGPSLRIERPSGGTPATFRYRDNETFEIDGRGAVYLASTFGVHCVDAYSESSLIYRPIYASAHINASSADLKKDIKALDDVAAGAWLDRILSLEPTTYLYNWEHIVSEGPCNPDERLVPHLGLIAEQVPSELKSWDGEGVDLYALNTALVAAVKELKMQMDAQAKEIRQLRDEVRALQSR